MMIRLALAVLGWQSNIMNNERVLKLDKVHNFRDYGGYRVSGGGRLRMGALFRSAHHGEASPQDLATIAKLGLNVIVDLRGIRERKAHPSRHQAGQMVETLVLAGETTGLPPHLQAEIKDMSPAAIRAMMVSTYRELPMREGLLIMLRRYIHALARPDIGASLVHCVAGKDRTGMAVALFHTMMGVHGDDVMADYLLTNTAGDQEARLAASAEAVRKRYGIVSEDALRTMMSVAPEYLESALAGLRETYGSVEQFFRTGLSVEPDMQAALHARYVED